MGEYYDLIMEPLPGFFSDTFSAMWKNKLSELHFECSNALQLRIGNHLRPKLTCWGAAFGSKNADDINLTIVAEVASFIEMLHKASIIIDDMIDKDINRHGKHTFHIQYGNDVASVYALLLISHGTLGIKRVFQDRKDTCDGVGLFVNTINRMAQGGLQELELTEETRFNIETIRNIIDFETVSLIMNSFLLGYWLSDNNNNPNIENVIENIGKNSGYIFQMYNDLEPYSCIEKNISYKGSSNIDINRSRKNIVAAYIYGASSQQEKAQMRTLTKDALMPCLLSLYKKYSIYELVIEECNTLEHCTHTYLNELASAYEIPCLDDFKRFITDMVCICRSKLRK